MRVKANGIDLYYEKCGSGTPIILLHGNGESHEIFDVFSEKLSCNYTVYALDSRSHGKSEKVESISYDTMANDVIDFINVLGISKPIIYGFSDGGIIGLIIAIKHPDLISALLASGANITPDGIKKKYFLLFKFLYFIKRNNLIKMMFNEPNITPQDLQKIKIPVLLTAGENDMIKESHTISISERIQDCKAIILKGEKHSSYIVHSSKIYDTVLPFLERVHYNG